MKRRSFMAAAASAGLPTLMSSQAFAQQFPERSIRIILPSSVGGSADAMMRLLTEPMRRVLGQPVIAENRPGASGAIGTLEVARAAPDGHTIAFIWSGPLSVVPILKPATGYDPLRDFAPISMVGTAPGVIMAHPSLPSDVRGLIEYAKSRPQGLEVGNAGAGSPGHLWAQLFAKQAGVKFVHVPYKGTSDAIPPLVAGDIKLIFSTTSAAYNNLARAGKIKIIGVASLNPSPLVPGVETIAKTLPGFETEVWYGVMAPARTPPEVVRKLNQAVVAAMNDANVKAKFLENAVAPMSGTPQQMADRMAKEYNLWKTLLADGSIKAE